MASVQGEPRVIIHIGLHKTGTRFLQRMVFAQLDHRRVNYNPGPLWQAIRDAVRNPGDHELAERARAEVARWRTSGDSRDLLLSEPHISGDMYGSHHDYPQNLQLMRELFPEATIIYFVRRQSDWLQSAYRQQLVKDQGAPIEVFLNWYDGAFHPRVARWAHGVRNVEAMTLQFLSIYRSYAAAYGPGNIYLFQQEDLRRRPEDVKRRLAEALGIDQLPAPPRERSQNRSYSALAIYLFYPGVHRRLPRPGPDDAGRPSRPRRQLTGLLRRLRRTLIQHGFDKIVYRDWDLLARHGMREQIERHYAGENAELNRIAHVILDSGPEALNGLEHDRRNAPGPTRADSTAPAPGHSDRNPE
ncbi:sulfotransferase [Aquisalimonas sp.]|uniref:sulfotransferase n=1 Tax=Aquisalimonas sp. TaxID=1872621 RepID=UPI0025BE7615|nr:sulfotransferase [Aquisalimonas sp.]